MSNDLLDDLKEEGYSDALVNGNMRGKPRDSLERYHSTGYALNIESIVCHGCGTIHRRLLGVMHSEKGDQGSSRARRIDPEHFSDIEAAIKLPAVYLTGKVAVCIDCIGKQGFSLEQSETLQ